MGPQPLKSALCEDRDEDDEAVFDVLVAPKRIPSKSAATPAWGFLYVFLAVTPAMSQNMQIVFDYSGANTGADRQAVSGLLLGVLSPARR